MIIKIIKLRTAKELQKMDSSRCTKTVRLMKKLGLKINRIMRIFLKIPIRIKRSRQIIQNMV